MTEPQLPGQTSVDDEIASILDEDETSDDGPSTGPHDDGEDPTPDNDEPDDDGDDDDGGLERE